MKIHNPGLNGASGFFFKLHKDVLPISVIWKSDDIYIMADASEVGNMNGRVVMKYMQLHRNYIFIVYNISSINKFILCLLI